VHVVPAALPHHLRGLVDRESAKLEELGHALDEYLTRIVGNVLFEDPAQQGLLRSTAKPIENASMSRKESWTIAGRVLCSFLPCWPAASCRVSIPQRNALCWVARMHPVCPLARLYLSLALVYLTRPLRTEREPLHNRPAKNASPSHHTTRPAASRKRA
jgi:hypothetical protein